MNCDLCFLQDLLSLCDDNKYLLSYLSQLVPAEVVLDEGDVSIAAALKISKKLAKKSAGARKRGRVDGGDGVVIEEVEVDAEDEDDWGAPGAFM